MKVMSMKGSRFGKILLLLGIVGASAWLQYVMDAGLGIGWVHNALRNWEHLGIWNLHGKLVSNSGGFEALTRPEFQSVGMSPLCLYLAYFSNHIFAWTGLGTMSFHILLVLAVFWGVWSLLGRDHFAFAFAAATVLSPGYIDWQRYLDMTAISVLLGLPYMALVVSILGRPRLGFGSILGLLVLTLGFVSLNWTSSWVLGPAALLLLGLPHVSRRAVLLFIALAGASCVLIVAVSVMAKAGDYRSVNRAITASEFLSNYTWGNIGYGFGLTTRRAVIRLSFVGVIGLLPELVLGGVWAAKYFQARHPQRWLVIAPFVLAVAELGVMRNYFGSQPWMGAPVLLAGLIFALALGRVRMEIGAAEEKIMFPQKPLVLPTVSLVCAIYGLAVTMVLRANNANVLSLVRLVRHHTQRSDFIVLLKNLDPGSARLVAEFNYHIDRHVVVADDLDHLPASKTRMVILSSLPLEAPLNLVAQSATDETRFDLMFHKTADWFNHHIARRHPGDRFEVARAYFLYQAKP